jgi:hypothetical protein
MDRNAILAGNFGYWNSDRGVAMISTTMRRAAMMGALITAAVMLTATAAFSATGPSHVQRRELAETTLSNFRVVLTATRGPGSPPGATVTASGFRRARGGRWQLISTRRIGRVNGWFWFSVDTCSLTATQFRSVPRTVRVASINVSLLATPSVGCSRTYTVTWRP